MTLAEHNAAEIKSAKFLYENKDYMVLITCDSITQYGLSFEFCVDGYELIPILYDLQKFCGELSVYDYGEKIQTCEISVPNEVFAELVYYNMNNYRHI